MTVTVTDFLEMIDGIAPFRLAEKWDNCGLQTGDPDWPVRRILVCLDVSPDVLSAAKDLECDLILSHHPLMMAPEKSLDFSRMPGLAVAASAVGRTAIVSAHTNLDKARDGLNDYFALKLGIDCTGPFLTEPADDDPSPMAGLGRLGTITPALSLRELAEKIKRDLNMPGLRVIGNLDTPVREVALCTGSGGSLCAHFLKSSAQVYLTGDLKYHEARDIEAGKKAAIDVGHFASEHIVTQLFKIRLEALARSRDLDLEVIEYEKDEDPFIII